MRLRATIPVLGWIISGIFLTNPLRAADLGALEDRFDAALLKAQVDYDRSKLRLDKGFSDHLAGLMASHQGTGKLGSTLAIKREIEWFSEEAKLGEGDLVEQPPDLLAAQQKYLKALATHDDALNKKKSKAYEIYISELESLKVKLTMAGKIDEAESAASKLVLAAAAHRALAELAEAARRLPVPDGAIEWQGHHYLVVVQSRVSFSDARAACEKLGGHLVFLESEDERKFVHQLKGRKTAWIGASDQDEEGTYTWLDGSEIAKELRNVIPQTNTRVYDCVLLTVDGVLVSRPKSGHHKSGIEKWVNRYVIEWDY